MKKLPVLLAVILIAVIGIITLRIYNRDTATSTTSPSTTSKNDSITATDSTSFTDFTASFEIYTNGTKRIFTDERYHNLSPDVYIENPDPSVIYVKKAGMTWDNFFKTLPMSLTKDCLVTGTKQTFCSTETKKLRFLLNGVENPNTLEAQIQPNDNIRVIYGD